MKWILRPSFIAVLFCTPCGASIIEAKASYFAPPDPVGATRHALDRGAKQIDDNDSKGAVDTLAGVIRSETFDALTPGEQYRALALATVAANATGDHRSALTWALRACVYADGKANTAIWHERLSAAYAVGDYPDAGRSIATIADRWPQTLAQINAPAIHEVARRLEGPKFEKAQFDLLRSLFDARWRSYEEEPSWLWLDLVRLHLNRHEVRKAVAVVGRVESPKAVVAMRADKRYDALRRIVPQAFDVDRAIAAGIAASEARVRASPKRLLPVVQLQYVLMASVRADEALKIADDVIASVDAADGRARYDDFMDQYAWILDNRASALWLLGRTEEAVKQQRRAARRPEHGELNVSQAINLAGYYSKLGRIDEALDAMADLGTTSPYGLMQVESIELIGAVQGGDQPGIEAHLDYLRAHKADAMSTFATALLDAGRVDEASDLLVERLHDPGQQRTDALVSMQTYAQTPQPALVRTREARWREVIARPAVRKALAEVGRIESFRLVSD